MYKLYYIGIALFFITSCGEDRNADQPGQTVNQEEEKGIVVLTSEQTAAIKLKTGQIEKRNLTNVIKANGYLDVPPQNNAVVSPMITGYVKQINFLVGDNVKKGQVMAELESMEFIDMQQHYVELNAQMMFLKEEFERQKLLIDRDAVSKKTFLKSEIEYKTAISMLEGLKSKLYLLGVNFEKLNQGKVEPRFSLRAPITGSIKMMNTILGKQVDPSEEVFEIINTEHIHLELSVYEQDASKVKKGQKVSFKIPSQNTSIFEGEVFLVGKDLSKDKRSINVHVHIEGDESQFTVGMYANATIVVEENPSNTLPVTAVVVDGNSEYIFRQTQLNDNQFGFEKIAVKTGIESDGLIEISELNELNFDDEIVVEGAFYLLNAFSEGE